MSEVKGFTDRGTTAIPESTLRTEVEVRQEERKRIVKLLKSIECVGCDMGVDCSFLDSRDYLILVIEENKHE